MYTYKRVQNETKEKNTLYNSHAYKYVLAAIWVWNNLLNDFKKWWKHNYAQINQTSKIE